MQEIQRQLEKFKPLEFSCSDGSKHTIAFKPLMATKQSHQVLQATLKMKAGFIENSGLSPNDSPEKIGNKFLLYFATEVPFDDMWFLAENLLAHAAIDNQASVSLNDPDGYLAKFFFDRYYELCAAVMLGLQVNFPKSFGPQEQDPQSVDSSDEKTPDSGRTSSAVPSMSSRLNRARPRSGGA